jgi:hypothetical protein
MKNMKAAIKKFKGLKSRIFGPKIDSYWVQETEVIRTHDRMKVFKPLVEGKKVLHVGCTDYPIFNPKTNLHLKLKDLCSTLHGMDVDSEGIEVLKGYYPGKYFESLKKADSAYDTILVPETIEHVENIALFLKEINSISAQNYIITGPNCFHNYFKNGFKKGDKFIEMVHPDHNCWFSPYTLKNAIEKYTNLKVDEIHLSNHDLMIVCICSKHG